MIQTFQGYFQHDGRFVADPPVTKLPPMRRAIVKILDDEIVIEPFQANTFHQQRIARIRKILADARAAEEDTMTDVEWAELTDIRARTNSGLSRVVDL